MDRVIDFLKACRTFYVATVDGDQPRVRPFGAAARYKNRIYIATNNQKDVFKQMLANPNVEICGIAPDGRWIRISGRAVADPDLAAKRRMLEENAPLKSMYSLDDGIFEVLYIDQARAVIYSFTAEPEVISL